MAPEEYSHQLFRGLGQALFEVIIRELLDIHAFKKGVFSGILHTKNLIIGSIGLTTPGAASLETVDADLRILSSSPDDAAL